jgi:hypothetical protein
MTASGDETQGSNVQLSDAYREAVGSVMTARRLYDQACADHGVDSLAAAQARDYLSRETDHRNRLRDQYDLVMDRGSQR